MLQLKHKNNEKPPFWLVDPVYTLGADSVNAVQATGVGIQAKHATINVNQDSITLNNLMGDNLIKVNGIPVRGERQLNHGDEVLVGVTLLLVLDPKRKDAAMATPPSDAKTPPRDNALEQDKTLLRDKNQWSLVATNTALQDRQYPLAGEVILGRSKECDICLSLSHLSRQHAKLTVNSQGQLFVEDMKSSNGTFVNGQKVSKSRLRPGDELSFDTLKFRVSGSDSDEDKTTIRPALKDSAAPHGHRVGGQAQAHKTAPPRHRTRQPIVAPVSERPVESQTGNTGLLLAVGVVTVIAFVVVWFFVLAPSK